MKIEKIAIVDDMKSDRLKLKKKLYNYQTEHHINFEITEFSSAESFLENFIPDYFTIIFLDIFMKDVTGMEAAKQIYQHDRKCKIIFLSSSPDYSLESYSVHAVYYLLKPISDETFHQAMDFCFVQKEYDVPTIQVTSGGSTLTIHTENILYVDYKNRQTLLHFEDSILPVVGSFSDVTARLQEDCRFLLCIRGLLVNMQYISDVKDSMFCLENGEQVPINLRNRKNLIQTYHNYVFEHMEV